MIEQLTDPSLLLVAGAVVGLTLLMGPRLPGVDARMRASGGDLAVWLLIVAAGPLSLTIESIRGEDDASGWLLLASQATTALVLASAAVSVVRTRRWAWTVVLGIVAFYSATILGAIFGTVWSFPQALWLTPLVLLAVARRDLSPVWVAQVVGRAAVSLITASLLAILLVPSVALQDDSRYLSLPRVSGMAVHANGLGAVAVVAIVVQVSRGRRISSPSVLLAAIALVVAQSWTGWLMLGTATVLLSGDRRWPTAARTATSAALAILMAAAAFMPSVVMPRIEAVASDDDAFTGRRRIWEVALAEHDESPWFGYGPALLDEEFRRRNGLYELDAAGQAHNQVVQTLGDAGYFGLLGLAVLVVAWLHAARRCRHEAVVPLLAILAVRGLSETPLRPAGASFLLVSVVALLSARVDRQMTAVGEAEKEHHPAAFVLPPRTRSSEVRDDTRSAP